MQKQNFLIRNKDIALRMVEEQDRERFFFLEQDAHTNRFIKIPLMREKIEESFNKFKQVWSVKDGEYHGFAIVTLDEGELKGMAFYRYRDKASEIIEIGWKLHPDAEGNGYATQAAKLLMKFLCANYPVHKFVAHCDADNGASERIMQKLDMLKEADFKSNFKIGETWRDEYAYGKLVET